MKALDIHNFSISPLLFQLAARLELPALRKVLKPALRAATKTKNESSETLRARTAESAENDLSNRQSEHSRESEPVPARKVNERRKTLFQLKAPAARSVKLVADFTDWEKYPLDMIQCDEGNWFAIVPLTPGSYSYRFIVDGQWLNDPQAQTAPNPFGSTNAIVQIQ